LELLACAELVSDNPRREFVDAIDGMFCNARQHEAQIGFRIDVVEFRGADQAIDRSGTLTTRVGAGEQVIAPFMPRSA
jgi:hypothetical protein